MQPESSTNDSSLETQTEALIEQPFDGVVRDHAVAWQHVQGAYGISFVLLFGYVAVVTFQLRKVAASAGLLHALQSVCVEGCRLRSLV